VIPPDLILAANPELEAKVRGDARRPANENAADLSGGGDRSCIDAREADRTGRSQRSIQLDQQARALMARATNGLSLPALTVAATDWAVHAAASPGLMTDLALQGLHNSAALSKFAVASLLSPASAEPPAPRDPHDRRFHSASWDRWPYSVMAQGFMLSEAWWDRFASDAPGLDRNHADQARFYTRQMLDAFCPANQPWLNPEVMETTLEQNGENLLRGAHALANDVAVASGATPPAAENRFEVGEDVACTPGKVVYRNHLIELIQYDPVTPEVDAEPILIVPAWIMKYYILDLSPENSLVRWLVSQGKTVFMMSWRNPDESDRDLTFDIYRRLGVMDAIEAALNVTGAKKLHGVGYCLGGTLLGVAASAMARDGDERLASLSLFAAQLDFSEAGELKLFIGESEIAMLEALMDERGYLDSRQMAGAFHMLRSNDLVWTRMVHDYFLGRSRMPIDIMAWNADATRMPAAMHSEYLRRFFLENAFSRGAYKVDGRAAIFSDVRCPVFAVGTETDHIAPWRSVFKIHQLADTEVTFALTSGGHNGGTVSEPGHPRRHHRIATKADLDHYADPDEWLAATPDKQGSWWMSWLDWLNQRADGARVAARKPKRASAPANSLLAPRGTLPQAPGEYVLIP